MSKIAEKIKSKLGGKPDKKPKKKAEPKKKSEDIDISEKIEQGYVLVRFLFEMVGGPKEYIEKTFKQHIDFIEKSSEHNIISKEVEPIQETDDGLFSCLAEVEILFKNINTVMSFVLDHKPSSIEVVEPEKFTFRSNDFSQLFNDLQAKLHTLDMLVKNTSAKNKLLEKNASLLLRNNVLINLKHAKDGMSLSDLSKATGIPEDQLKPFMDKLTVQDLVEEKESKFFRK